MNLLISYIFITILNLGYCLDICSVFNAKTNLCVYPQYNYTALVPCSNLWDDPIIYAELNIYFEIEIDSNLLVNVSLRMNYMGNGTVVPIGLSLRWVTYCNGQYDDSGDTIIDLFQILFNQNVSIPIGKLCDYNDIVFYYIDGIYQYTGPLMYLSRYEDLYYSRYSPIVTLKNNTYNNDNKNNITCTSFRYEVDPPYFPGRSPYI